MWTKEQAEADAENFLLDETKMEYLEFVDSVFSVMQAAISLNNNKLEITFSDKPFDEFSPLIYAREGTENLFEGTWTREYFGGQVSLVITGSGWTSYYEGDFMGIINFYGEYNSGTYTYNGKEAAFTVTNKGIGFENVDATVTGVIQSGGKINISGFSDNAMNGIYSR